jgi:hypothetical protein
MQIQAEYDQYQYREKLNRIKQIYESSSLKNTFIEDTFNHLNNNSNSNFARKNDESYLSDPESSPIYDDGLFMHKENNNDFVSELKSKNYTYLENFVRRSCLFPFYYIEIIHSSVLIILGVNIKITNDLQFRNFKKQLKNFF